MVISSPLEIFLSETRHRVSENLVGIKVFALVDSKKVSSLSFYGAFSFIYVFMYKFSRIQTRIGGVEVEDVDY